MSEAQGAEAHEQPAAQHVAEFLEQAVSLGASDLFFASDENAVLVAVRRLGMMLPLASGELDDGRRWLNFVKAMAGIDLAERRRPQDGRWIYQCRAGRKIDIRINTLPTLYGEDMTLRLFDRDVQLRQLDQLGLLQEQQNELLALLTSPSGLVLVCGPTGSGKTTTLYACLRQLNDGKRKINTIEDPVEYALDGVRQSQVNLLLKVDFPDLLRSVLRQAPDVIMIGEIRDSLTAQTAVRAANSGHLVLATLHAPIAAAAVHSMLALSVPAYFLASCLRGIIAQRLVRVLCPACRTTVDISMAPFVFDDVRERLAPEQGTTLYAAGRCEQCHHTGFVDRMGIFEVLPASPKLRELIAARATTGELQQQAIAHGMLDFRRAGLVQAAAGRTTIEEILRVVPAEYLGIEE